MKGKITDRLQTLRGLDTPEHLAAADYAAERSLALIKAYCNIDEVPEELLGVAVSLAGWILDCGMGAIETSGRVRSIQEGDISISFAQGQAGETIAEGELPKYFAVELDRFRRLYR